MRIVKVGLENLCTYESFETEFPVEGLTVLVGPNGAGKSVLGVEALPWVLWGESVRDARPVPDGAAWVEIEDNDDFTSLVTETCHVRRVRQGRKTTTLDLHREGSEVQSGQTPTETQAKIDSLFGNWTRFAATRIFSKKLLARFSAATDKERKALLEGILGLTQFEDAYKIALKDSAIQEKIVAEARVVLRVKTEDLDKAQAWVANLTGHPDFDLPVMEAALAEAEVYQQELRGKLEKVHAAHQNAIAADMGEQASLSALIRQVAQEEAAIAAGEKRKAAGASMKVCPTCLRGTEPEDIRHIVGHFEEMLAPVRQRLADLEGEKEVARQRLAEAREDSETLRQSANALRAELSDNEGRIEGVREEVAQARTWKEESDRRRAAVDAAKLTHSDAADVLGLALVALQRAELAAGVLGPRGARVRLFSAALARLEVAANDYLARRFPLRFAISGTKTQASGKEVADVSLAVLGAGGGSYGGASDGEQVRLDVALILGLAEIAGDEGLIVFDEVFDALDEDGLEWVSDILQEMARERQVIVTTHNPRFLGLLPAGAVWQVSRGEGERSVVTG